MAEVAAGAAALSGQLARLQRKLDYASPTPIGPCLEPSGEAISNSITLNHPDRFAGAQTAAVQKQLDDFAEVAERCATPRHTAPLPLSSPSTATATPSPNRSFRCGREGVGSIGKGEEQEQAEGMAGEDGQVEGSQAAVPNT